MGGACNTHGRDKKFIQNFGRKNPEGKRQLGRPRRRWENNIRMDRRERLWEGVARMHLDGVMDQWRAVENTVMNLGISGGHFLD
jgi:hypothetical protein